MRHSVARVPSLQACTLPPPLTMQLDFGEGARLIVLHDIKLYEICICMFISNNQPSAHYPKVPSNMVRVTVATILSQHASLTDLQCS